MRGRLLIALVAVFVAVQLVVPVRMLFEQRPSPFGWQMYTAARSLPEIVAIEEDGSERVVEVTDHLAGRRVEIDYAARFAEQACRLVDAPRIRVIPADGAPVEVECE
jgi:hypothetical protein